VRTCVVPESAPIRLDELLARAAAADPQQIALVDPVARTTISYGELHARAREHTRSLEAAGVCAGARVAVLLDKSFEAVAWIYGILGAGAAYVPIDPHAPHERVEYILRDANVCGIVRNDGAGPAWQARTASAEPASNTAYILYTSTSTGQPRGVVHTHAGALAFLDTHSQVLAPQSTDCFSCYPPYQFDMSTLDLFLPVMHRARGVLITQDSGRVAPALAQIIAEAKITVWYSVPTVLRMLLQFGRLERRKGWAVRYVLMGGEPMWPADARRLQEVWTGARFFNVYGSTETNNVTYFELPSPVPQDRTTPFPIGRPFPNVEVAVVDAALRDVTPGTRGELLLRGDTLMKGYLGDPERTSAALVTRNGGTWYRSGDIVSQDASGDLVIIGRTDRMVKRRGFRIELVELELGLADHPAVREVAIVADKRGPEVAIHAYFIPREADVSTSDLTNFMLVRLPLYMIPDTFTSLAAIPRTSAGAPDAEALLAHRSEKAAAEPIAQAPAGSSDEATIASELARLLGRDRVGVDENFFALGGHSLLAHLAASRINQRFDIELPITSVFQSPTAAALAREVKRVREQARRTQQPPLVPIDRHAPLRLSPTQEGLWFLHRLDPKDAAYNNHNSYRLRGALDIEKLRAAIERIVARHESLRTSFPTEGGIAVQQIAAPRPFVLPQEDLSALAFLGAPALDGGIATSLRREIMRPFDLEAAPGFRARLLKLGSNDHVLALTLHHIVSDEWSMELLWSEIASHYKLAKGDAASIPTLSLQYADYAAWQRARQTGNELESQLGFWTENLRDAPVATELPRKQPRASSNRCGDLSIELGPDLAAALWELGRQCDATPFMTLVTALRVTLYRRTGQADLCIGTPIANRDRPELEHMIGLFINTIVLRARIASGSRFRDLLAQARATAIEAYTHREAPIHEVVDRLGRRDLGQTTLFSILFAHQNVPAAPVALPGLRVEPMPRIAGGAQTDLTLYSWEHAAGCSIWFVYNAELFDADAIRELADAYRETLSRLVAEPDRPI
jgi:amino acid adenylation domain-containing protein